MFGGRSHTKNNTRAEKNRAIEHVMGEAWTELTLEQGRYEWQIIESNGEDRFVTQPTVGPRMVEKLTNEPVTK